MQSGKKFHGHKHTISLLQLSPSLHCDIIQLGFFAAPVYAPLRGLFE